MRQRRHRSRIAAAGGGWTALGQASVFIGPLLPVLRFAVPDGEGSSALRAVVVAGGSAPAPRELAAALANILPRYAVPAEIAVVSSLPRTPTGKVDRKALAARPGSQEVRDDR